MADGFAGLLGKWGPGDHRAAVSLWTQGYFGRFFRPVLAYGLIHDIWFSPRLADVSVALSEIKIPARFALKRVQSASVEQHLWSIVHEHAQPVIENIVSLTGTSERLHWSNASFAFYRSYQQIRTLWSEAEIPAAVATQRRQVERLMASDHPLFQLSRQIPGAQDEQGLVRKVCCIRFKLDGLKKCGAACPVGHLACSAHRKADIHARP
ncbi:siderophore-iron reductase FhuF [Pararhizobium sp. BT-229]|uniref:siderophore-iron reductase FhuF n=1 Tax=Pararhizobium sp. BT-229 TaxID=2986923 RepID=UPI0021F6BE3B|nr:siderophore-iron reductase FhuF [Pararhizobium sp. BT-229]MCV9967231.1 siderophore-iron reductase FhuF [Pararhizobium sp. BT-229]